MSPTETMDRLKDWLVAKQGPKFVISPSMLLPRHRRAVQRDSTLEWSNLSALHSDSWDGYPNTLREVLAYIAAKKIRHVVFLSGDEHRGWVAAADLFDAAGNPITRVHSIHSAAIYAPFPFANSIDEDLVEDETIDIVHEGYGNYRCVVKAMPPPPGDGMTFLFVRQVAGTWQLDYEFADGMVRTLSL